MSRSEIGSRSDMPLIRAPLLVFRRGLLVLFADFEVMRGRGIKGETIQNSIVVEQIAITGKHVSRCTRRLIT